MNRKVEINPNVVSSLTLTVSSIHCYSYSCSQCLKHTLTEFCNVMCTGSEEDLGSSEESGKDWDELEEEAKKGTVNFFMSKRFLIILRNKCDGRHQSRKFYKSHTHAPFNGHNQSRPLFKHWIWKQVVSWLDCPFSHQPLLYMIGPHLHQYFAPPTLTTDRRDISVQNHYLLTKFLSVRVRCN